MFNDISDIRIIDKLPSSDHLPLSVTFRLKDDIKAGISCATATPALTKKTSNWSRSSDSDKALYTNKSRCLLDNIKLPAGVMSCTDNRCTDITHRYELDILYTDICSALYEAGLASIPSSDCNSSNQHVVPGWNEYVYGTLTLKKYVTWRDFGKPRQGPVHELMRSTRLRFKYALRQCQSRQETARVDALARNLSSKDMTSFWKSIKTINNKRIPLASTINGVTGEHDISEL